MFILKILVSAMPVLLPMLFLVILRMSSRKGMLLTALIFISFSYFVWGMNGAVLSASVIQGIHKALSITWILAGAIMLLKVNTHNGNVGVLKESFKQITRDMRIQAVIIAFLFVALIEGAAGFGTPAVVAGPLLVALGFPALAAATISLIGDSVSVSFGAIGTPVLVGLDAVSGGDIDFLHRVARNITRVDAISMVILPVIIVFTLTKFFKKNSTIKDTVEIIPWCIFIGVVYSVCANVFATLLGPEFVSVLSAVVSMMIAVTSVKMNFLIPKNVWRISDEEEVEEVTEAIEGKRVFLACFPYLLLVAFLLVSRLNQPLKLFTLQNLNLSITDILGQGITSNWQILYSPGTILLLTSICAFLTTPIKEKVMEKSVSETLQSVKNTFIVLSFILAYVQVFVNSGNLGDGVKVASMSQFLAGYLGEIFSTSWVFVAPFIGMLGSFITGSATVSTLTFAQLQNSIALKTNLSPLIILSQQVIGGADGNMICILNVVAATSVVGLVNREGDVIRKTLLPCLLYVGIASFMGGYVLG